LQGFSIENAELQNLFSVPGNWPRRLRIIVLLVRGDWDHKWQVGTASRSYLPGKGSNVMDEGQVGGEFMNLPWE